MHVSYAEARNMVFPKIDIPDRSYWYENISSHQSVPVGLRLFSLRAQRISSLHPDASAERSRGSIPRIDVRHEISAVRFRDPANRRRIAPDQSLRPARANDSRSHHRQHFVVSQSDESGRPRPGARCHDPMGRRVRERAFGVHRNLSSAGRYQNNARAPAFACGFASLTNQSTNSTMRKEHMSRTIKAIERHMAPPSKREAVEPHAPKLVGEWQQRGPETFSGFAVRKLRLAFAPSQSTNLVTVNC
jgi:hypothetical protein